MAIEAIWTGGPVATMTDGDFGLIPDGTVAVEGGAIAWVGPAAQGPSEAPEVHRLDGRVMTPGLIDSHTHIVHIGHSLIDFQLITQGADREALKKAGGGVRRTVAGVRAASEDTLFEVTARRVEQLIAAGVTVLESKSGYGLDLDGELKQMRVSRRLGRHFPLDVVSTFLGAHGLAPEFDGRRDDYIAFLCDTVLPAAVAEGIVDMVDGFCDYDGFNHDQTDRMFEAAARHGLPVTLHADQYTDFDAGKVAARHGAKSAAHLEYANESTIEALAKAGTVATLLPGANWILGDPKKPPVDLLRKHAVAMALATNNNPTSSPCLMPTMMMHMGCRLFGMTTAEAVHAFTTSAAKALGLEASHGTIAGGKAADLAIWDVADPAELPYRIAFNPCAATVKAGRTVFKAKRPQIVTGTG